MHPALRSILLDLRAVSRSRKVEYLTMLRESLRIHHTLHVSYKGKSVELDAAQYEAAQTAKKRDITP